MSERELRRILREVMDDLDAGRLGSLKPRRFLRRAVAPALLAVSLGLAGCESEGVGAPPDTGPSLMYAAPLVDAGADADAASDASWGCPNCVYMAPPPIEPDGPDDSDDSDDPDASE